MSRSVVLKGTERCEQCRFAPRWCVCAGFRAVGCPVQVDVLIHRREVWRPTSTGRLVNRVMPSSRGHVFSHDIPLVREAIVRPGRTLWILHPLGAPAPVGMPGDSLQVLLLDGSWREAARMRKAVESWGHLVSLPRAGPSRYRLRSQHTEGHYSTIEALAILLSALGEHETAGQLLLQFELHVYAGLRSRGTIREAAEFLESSPLVAAMPEVLRALKERRREG